MEPPRDPARLLFTDTVRDSVLSIARGKTAHRSQADALRARGLVSGPDAKPQLTKRGKKAAKAIRAGKTNEEIRELIRLKPDTREYAIYVIELDDNAGPGRHHEQLCNVYVGITDDTILNRYKKHREGKKTNDDVEKHHVRLRPDLYDGLPTVRITKAERHERDYAERLRGAGYTVRTDGGWLPRRAGQRRFSLAELPSAQVGHLDASILSVLANPLRPLSAGHCANVLWGSRGAQLAEWGMPRLPEYGRFAHLAQPELVERVHMLERAGHLAPYKAGLHARTLRPNPLW